MTEPERDERIVQAYRDLGDEAPPPALDAAILAAARRRGMRWQVPAAAAAALVLAVGVALVVQREEPRTTEEVALAPQVIPTPAPATAPAPEARRDLRADAPRELLAKAREPAPAASGEVPAAPAVTPKPMVDERRAKDSIMQSTEAAGVRGTDHRAAPAGAAPAPAARTPIALEGKAESDALGSAVAGKAETPERWLERIAKLREAGRDKEADESLAEFRRRHPDYRIAEEMRVRVLPR